MWLRNNLIFPVLSLRLIYADYPIVVKIGLKNILIDKRKFRITEKTTDVE